ncbi:MAG: GNAT family N-acetyltransferase, partial [Saprospiraceae bacterium]|nr:GNAT family N-acetyltransferase [Saprospiraceae bacterium]
ISAEMVFIFANFADSSMILPPVLMTKRQPVSKTKSALDHKILVTERLYLREAIQEDLNFLVDLHSDPDVMRYIGPLRNREAVAVRLQKIQGNYKVEPGLGIWMACKKEDHQKIGWACLKQLDSTTEIEIGYRLAKQFWRFGYATELTRGLLAYGFVKKRLPFIVGVARPENNASIRVLIKAGLVFEKMAYYYKSDMAYYKLKRETYLSVGGSVELTKGK